MHTTTFWTRLALTGTLALACCGAALAQESGPASSADELIQKGLQVLRQVDEDRGGDVWDAAAPFVKAKFSKAEMTATMRQSRATIGTVAQRTWASVSRTRYTQPTDAGAPPGLYASIDYSTRLSDGRTVFELLSFRQEPDGWRLTGYVPRQQQ